MIRDTNSGDNVLIVLKAKFLGVVCTTGQFCCKRRARPGSRITPEVGKQFSFHK
jgi:hypothetical protein